ncbi:MAG: coproporphyrinogen III oxidase [Marinovum sp.]|nr:coproporphyrinogen III oxidase [Marinovum sp.]
MNEDWQNGGFGIYVHWPFCAAKCPYCDFNSHVSDKIYEKQWVTSYLVELDRLFQTIGSRPLKTVFFGGGTPSLMSPELVDQILSKIFSLWPRSNDLEVSLEANPTSVEAGRFNGYQQAGVNRISLGVQALNDADLKRLGRLHSVKEAHLAFDISRNTFDRVSFDLIYARQNQTLTDWRSELGQALSMAIDHVSLYQLTIEQGTAFGDRYAIGKLSGLPNEDLGADLFEATQDICGEFGFPAYEISNHTKNGAECRHNMVYWRYGDYAGIGPGAHGRLTINGQRRATAAFRNPEDWLEAVRQGCSYETNELLSPKDQATEYLVMGLRINEGIDQARYRALSGCDLDQEKISRLVDQCLISDTNNTISASQRGRPVLNHIIRELAG